MCCYCFQSPGKESNSRSWQTDSDTLIMPEIGSYFQLARFAIFHSFSFCLRHFLALSNFWLCWYPAHWWAHFPLISATICPTFHMGIPHPPSPPSKGHPGALFQTLFVSPVYWLCQNELKSAQTIMARVLTPCPPKNKKLHIWTPQCKCPMPIWKQHNSKRGSLTPPPAPH